VRVCVFERQREIKIKARPGVRFPKASLANYGRKFRRFPIEFNRNCDHSWLTMLSGNAPLNGPEGGAV